VSSTGIRMTPSAVEAAESVGGGEAAGLPTVHEALTGVSDVLSQGGAVIREAVGLEGELVRIAVGRSEIAPAKGDRRFTDPAWTANPAYHRLEQAYLAWAAAVRSLVDESRGKQQDPRRAERATLMVNILTSALAPTNFFATNPAAIKRAFDTGGMSVLRGMRNFISDLRHNGGLPSMVERGAFEVGRNLAVTPGAVVARDEVAEVLQYRPSTETTFDRPLLVIPPMINRFYVLDLASGRSFVEHAVSRGLQTFQLSWRNPTPEQGHWDLDTYARRLSTAIDTVREITGSEDVNVIGFCAGGIVMTTLLNHLAAAGDGRVHSASYAVTLLDFGERAPLSAFSGPRLVETVRRRSRRKGIITSRQMGAAFTWMRPDDLVFNYWVNNYLMGEKPPAFDILAWNADGTNLPGALHGQFLDIFQHNLLTRPAGVTVLGSPLNLRRIKIPLFVNSAIADHLTPWKGCYRTTQLLGGENTFVLSYSGHVASLVNPPDNPKAHYWTGDSPGPDPDAWLAKATKHQGSWWDAWVDWITPRAGTRRSAPDRLGSDRHPVLDPAPGRYVRDLPAT